MRQWILFGLLLAAAAVIAEDQEDTTALECDLEACQLPNCRCSGTDIPGGLDPRDVPQLVAVTFEDAVNVRNIVNYRSLLYNRKNSDNCPAGATFYINHEYTEYVFVNELYNQGFEIALRSITYQTPQSYWADATYETMVREFVDQRAQITHFANIPHEYLKGVRLPFLQMNGDVSFQMMADNDLLYDNSMPTIAYTNPALWPYTLDYKSTQDCIVPPCPTSSIPGPWVIPIVAWSDLQSVPCSFIAACQNVPDYEDEEGWYQFMITNFERHYRGNRAPFPIYMHEWLLDAYPAIMRAFVRFLNLLNSLPDVFMVNSEEVIEWVKNPISITEYKNKECRSFIRTTCNYSNCGPLLSEHNNAIYYMQICNTCPRVYPWLNNPFGL